MLVIDDDIMTLKMLLDFLKTHDYKVTGVQNGVQAMAEIRENHFDFIILDLTLRGMNGFEICNRLRKDKIITSMGSRHLRGHASKEIGKTPHDPQYIVGSRKERYGVQF